MSRSPKDNKPYLLWLDYGLDGWVIHATADTPDELLELVRSTGAYGNEFLITKVVKFKAVKK